MQMTRERTRRMETRPAPVPIPALWPGERPVLPGAGGCTGEDSSVDEVGESMCVLVLTAIIDVPVKLDAPVLISEDCHSIWNIGAARRRLVLTVVDPCCVAVKGINSSDCSSMKFAPPSHWPTSRDVDVAVETQVCALLMLNFVQEKPLCRAD